MTNDNPYYQYQNDGSLIVPDTSAVLADVQNLFREVFGESLSVEASTPQGRLIEIIAAERKAVIEFNALISNQININTASGKFLDALGSLFGVRRMAATSTSVLASVTGIQGTVIPAGSQAKTTEGDLFQAENAITIGENGTAEGYFVSVEKGAIPCPSGSLTQIISQLVGWETISNSVAPVIGNEPESDMDFRIRIGNSRYSGVALIQAIRTALNAVENVRSYFLYNNPTGAAVQVDGVSVPAHSICLVIDGGEDMAIGRALLDTVSAGCGYTAISGQSTVVDVPDNAGVMTIEYPITFNRPQLKAIDAAISVRPNTYTGEDLSDAVKNAVLTWAAGGIPEVDGIKIGTRVTTFEIGAAVSNHIPSIFIEDVKICLHGGTPAYTPLDFTISQIANIPSENISVTIVED